jgi:hypothetical protein
MFTGKDGAMAILDSSSLAQTLANVNVAVLQGSPPRGEANKAAEWIASRAGAEGSYYGLPTPTTRDYRDKMTPYTGEPILSHVGVCCRLGFEAAWALAALRPDRPAIRRAAQECLRLSVERFLQNRSHPTGMYCCYPCSVAGWRALGAAKDPKAKKLLEAALALLRPLRTDAGRWRCFPFWHTVLTLNGIEHPLSSEELRHAAPALERALAGRDPRDALSHRRRRLARHVLARAF